MESIGAFPEGEWEFYNKIFSVDEPDFAAEVLGQYSFPLENSEGSQSNYSSSMYSIPETIYESMAMDDGTLVHCGPIHQNINGGSDTNCTIRVGLPPSFHQSYFSNELQLSSGIPSSSMDFEIIDEKTSRMLSHLVTDMPMGENTFISDQRFSKKLPISELDSSVAPKREMNVNRKLQFTEQKTIQINQTKKRIRVAVDTEKKKKNVKSKKNCRSISSDAIDSDQQTQGGADRQSLTCYSSDEENASQDSNGGTSSESKASLETPNSNKTRASRGSATDPQSLYARKRRERINERLRILQNLVPNGTKVDISTMLEEAVHYVKFLQLQIKLLSSDDLWMFAPIAYNGVDIGLNQKISMLL